jgi:hypothetical protein
MFARSKLRNDPAVTFMERNLRCENLTAQSRISTRIFDLDDR